MLRWLVPACCLGLFGCSAAFNTSSVPGAANSGVTCTGMAIAVRACIAQAAQSCAGGHYTVYDQTGSAVGDERSGLGASFLRLVETTGSRVVCTPAGPNLASPPPA